MALERSSVTDIVDIAEARRFRAGNEPLLSKRDLAEQLGFSVRWIEYRVREGMPHKVIGGRLRFQRTVVESWLQTRELERSA
jgi:hypothetical protein